jgi:hypothetical protein
MQEELNQLRHDDPDAFGRRLTEMTIQADRELKIDITKDGPEDIPNRVMYMPAANDNCNIVVPATLGMEIPAPDVIAISGSMANQEFGPPFLVAWLAEAYVQAWIDPNDPDIPTERGQLTQRFMAGDKSVLECLSITTVHRRADNSFRVLAVSQAYRYVNGSVIFDEETWVDSLEIGEDSHGPVVEQLIAVFGSEQN